jgi:hypothetical protein
MHWRHPSSKFVNARPAQRHPGGGIDGRSCQPQRGCNRKLSSRIDRHALVARDALVDQANPQRSLGRPNGERLDAARVWRKVYRNRRAARGLRKHEHAVVEWHRTIAVTTARNRCIGFFLARPAIVNAAMEIDATGPRRCDLEHKFKAPERRAQCVTYARLTFVVNGIRFRDPVG